MFRQSFKNWERNIKHKETRNCECSGNFSQYWIILKNKIVSLNKSKSPKTAENERKLPKITENDRKLPKMNAQERI